MFTKEMINKMLDNAITHIIDPDEDLTIMAGAVCATDNQITRVCDCVACCLDSYFTVGIKYETINGEPFPPVKMACVDVSAWVEGVPYTVAYRDFIVKGVEE